MHNLAIFFLPRAHVLIKRTSSGEIAAKRDPNRHCEACLLNLTSINSFLDTALQQTLAVV
jgi:hypothetical protein